MLGTNLTLRANETMIMLHASPITMKYTAMNVLHASPITPFLTESAREKELAESVACMKRQAGMTDRWMSSEAARHHGIFHGDRAGTEHALGDLYQPDRASLQHVHGDVFHGDRACMQNVHGGVFLGDRASMQHVHGSVSHGGPIPRQLFVFQGFLIQLLLQCCYFSFKPKIPSRSW